jgi:hypothetical protein
MSARRFHSRDTAGEAICGARLCSEWQIESIYFSKGNPSAVINGTWVHPRDRLPAGATAVEIGPSSVTLEFESERKVLALK